LGGRVSQVNVDLKAGVLHLEASLALAALIQRDLPGLGITHRHSAPVVIICRMGLCFLPARLIGIEGVVRRPVLSQYLALHAEVVPQDAQHRADEVLL
jgi:hypothetical protein